MSRRMSERPMMAEGWSAKWVSAASKWERAMKGRDWARER